LSRSEEDEYCEDNSQREDDEDVPEDRVEIFGEDADAGCFTMLHDLAM
jgi:hypothetical protein